MLAVVLTSGVTAVAFETKAADEVLAVVLTSGVTAVAFETKDWLETAGSALLAAGSW